MAASPNSVLRKQHSLSPRTNFGLEADEHGKLNLEKKKKKKKKTTKPTHPTLSPLTNFGLEADEHGKLNLDKIYFVKYYL